MVRPLVWLITLSALALLACSEASAPSPPPVVPPQGPGAQTSARDRALTLEMTIETADVRAVDDALRALTEREGGYVELASATQEAASLTSRVPAERLAAFRRAARRLGDVTHERQGVEDVGAQRVDLDARLLSARGEEERLRALMSERTETLADVLAVEARIGEVRTRIEQLEAQRAELGQRIAYAVVRVGVQHASAAFWEQPGVTIASAGSWGLSMVRAIAVGAAAAVIALGPTALLFALLLAALVAGLRWAVRRRTA